MFSKKELKTLLNEGLSTGANFAEIFCETSVANVMEMTKGKISKVTANIIHGVGFRILKNTEEVYGYTNDTTYDKVLSLVRKVASSFQGKYFCRAQNFEEVKYQNITPVKKRPEKVSVKTKAKYLRQAWLGTKKCGKEIVQVIGVLTDKEQRVLIANSNGVYAKDVRTNCRLTLSAIASDGKEMQSFNKNTGRNMGYEYFDTIDFQEFGRQVAEGAITMLHADLCTGGKMTVVVHNGFGGVLLHEACVHSLEATSVAKGSSVFCNKLNQKIASDIVTAVDDGTIQNSWGSLNVDDEGHRTQKNILIKDGVLQQYLVDYRNSLIMNLPVTGNGRRQSYKYSPTSRMTNTFFAPGKSTFDEIIAATEYGLFAKSMGGGSVNPASGEFNFAVLEGYMIENGKITKPVKGATLVGSGAEILMNIDMIADNLLTGHGMCGSQSGSIPTDVGQPTIRVQNITVGGRK